MKLQPGNVRFYYPLVCWVSWWEKICLLVLQTFFLFSSQALAAFRETYQSVCQNECTLLFCQSSQIQQLQSLCRTHWTDFTLCALDCVLDMKFNPYIWIVFIFHPNQPRNSQTKLTHSFCTLIFIVIFSSFVQFLILTAPLSLTLTVSMITSCIPINLVPRYSLVSLKD